MDKGRIVYDGASAALQTDPALLETYLGVTERAARQGSASA
jgi:ABC-type branched-subunit amino acid transport system ATPase component